MYTIVKITNNNLGKLDIKFDSTCSAPYEPRMEGDAAVGVFPKDKASSRVKDVARVLLDKLEKQYVAAMDEADTCDIAIQNLSFLINKKEV